MRRISNGKGKIGHMYRGMMAVWHEGGNGDDV